MNTRNLIPLSRRASQSQKRSLRRWIAICAMYACLLSLAGVVMSWITHSRSINPADFERLNTEITHNTAKLTGLKSTLTSSRRALDSAREIAAQPDWSVLMSSIGERRGDDVVFSQCELTRQTGASKDAPPLSLQIQGIGASQEAIASLVLRLQEIDVLSNVRLIQTTRRAFRGQDAVSFHLVCSISAERSDR